MGNPIGFKIYEKEELERIPSKKRVLNSNEFELSFTKESLQKQATRCMDCGIPFCNGDTGCPVHNYIPDWNHLVYKNNLRKALDNLHSTNNFPEFTGRLCPAPCESACVLGITKPPVSIKAIERSIIDTGFEKGWVVPKPAKKLNGASVAIVGSGPAGLACAQELARYGFKVTVFEKNARIGGLLRLGIPDFKMEKHIIDRRMLQMEQEGVVFKTNICVGKDIYFEELKSQHNYVVLAGGCENPRDLPIKGRDGSGIHFAMEFLKQENDRVAGIEVDQPISAKDKHVVVIGGGDTGSDCIGTSNRHGAKCIIQLELFSKPPTERSEKTPWPYWPMKLRTSSSQEEGTERLWSINTKEFILDSNKVVVALLCEKVEFKNGEFRPIPNSEFEIKADLVLLAMGFIHPLKDTLLQNLEKLGLNFNTKNNVKAIYGQTENSHKTSIDGVYVCGDMRRGQSLIVWAISEGRYCAEAILENFTKNKKTSFA